MFKKMLLASTAGFIVVAGAFYAGAASSQEAQFVFRYSSGVLPVAAGGSETENPGGEDGGTGETDPDDEDEEGGPDDEDEDEEEPVGGITFAPPVISLQDSNGNGFGDLAERVYLRSSFMNESSAPISSIRTDYRISLGSWSTTGSCNATTLAPGEALQCASPVYLTGMMLASLASGLTFEAESSLTGWNGETHPFETHAKAATVEPFGAYAPVMPGEISVSSVSAAHIDTDGDGYGDRGEIVRISFTARNNGGLPAQGVSFEMSFPSWPDATAYCDRASLPASGSMSCSADIELTRSDLDGFGPPETVVSLFGAISLVALNGDHFPADDYSTALAEVSFTVPPVTYAPHLRIVASEGWAFECATPWDAAFVADHQDMLLTRWDTGSRTIVAAGGNTVSGKSFNLQSTWILLNGVDVATMKAGAFKNSMKSGDTRPAIPSSIPQPCGNNGKFNVVAHGDLTTAYPVFFESVEVVNLSM